MCGLKTPSQTIYAIINWYNLLDDNLAINFKMYSHVPFNILILLLGVYVLVRPSVEFARDSSIQQEQWS